MPRRISSRTTLDHLKRDAKRWLAALRENDPTARARLEQVVPDAPAAPALRHVQHALAREQGFPGWAALKEHLARQEPDDTERASLLARFLDNACPDHHVRGGPDHVRARHTALRLLERYPELRHASFATAAVCGDLREVSRQLATRPQLAVEKDGTPDAEREGAASSGDLMRKDLGMKGWEPLLYVCFTRLPLPDVDANAVAIARLLLDSGANPNAFFMAGGSRYTPLVGAIGEGEEDRPPHPQRDALVRLLLERGAEPYDIQVIYNIHFHGQVLWFLELIHDRSLELGRRSDWDDPEWSMLGMGGYGSGARWHLWIAIRQNDVRLAEWCLSHGASPDPAPPRAQNLPQGTLYEYAVRAGRTEIADLLVRYGATPTPVRVDGIDAFIAACLRLDRDAIRAQLAEHPEYLQAPEPMLAAAELDRVDVLELLLDLGVSPDVANAQNERPLHAAAYHNALDAATLLMARGAEIDPVESNWGNTPLGAAVYPQHQAMIDLLAPHSRDVWQLTYTGKLDRLREVLSETPERARVVAGGHTPLMWLPPEDETVALEVARVLIGHGANASLRNEDEMTAADRAERLGMFRVAAFLRDAASTRR
jgi:ankyrin repeat protein